MMSLKVLPVSVALCLILNFGFPDQETGKGKETDDPVFIMIGSGSKAAYIKKGDEKQGPVAVSVGQTVIWTNTDENMAHTATSDLEKDGKRLFDTGHLESTKSAKVVFDQDVFERAGGKKGGEVELKYHCIYHKLMKGVIILKSTEAKK